LEAKLIEAEADLAGPTSGTWLSVLRMLRETCIGTATCAPVPGLTVTNLPVNDLADPGTPATRLDLLMRERAMWLFATGHRQGDMRRLARIYARNPETIWPNGIYRNLGFPPFLPTHPSNGTSYGKQYVLDHGVDTNNPLYAGCLDMDP